MTKPYEPRQPFNLGRAIKFWTQQSLTQCKDKGGSFDVDLYLRVLDVRAKNNQ
jgi:hypothetical protein